MIRPVLEYTAPALIHISNKNLESMETLQCRAARIALQLPYTQPNGNILDECHLPTIDAHLHTLHDKFMDKATTNGHALREFIRQQLQAPQCYIRNTPLQHVNTEDLTEA